MKQQELRIFSKLMSDTKLQAQETQKKVSRINIRKKNENTHTFTKAYNFKITEN